MNKTKYSEQDIYKLIYLQKFLRKQLNIKNKLQDEIDYLLSFSNKIITRINNSYNELIINENEYKIYMDDLTDILNKLIIFPIKLNFRIIKQLTRYRIMVTIAEIKLKFINLVQKTGSQELKDILKLILNLDISCNNVDQKYNNLIKFYNKVFNTTGCDIYESTNNENISFKLFNNGKQFVSDNNIKLTSFQTDYPSCNKISIFTKSLIQKLYGAKLYIPLKGKLLVIYGYFIKDDLNILRNERFLKEKEENLIKCFMQLDVGDIFKDNYLKQISLKDFIILTIDDICNNCINAYNDLKKIKNKNISALIKEFLLNDLEKQRYYITLLILDSLDADSYYLANLLYDLISSDSTLINNKNFNHLTLYSSLHWSVQKLFKTSKKEVEKLNEKLYNFYEDNISYEKRIHLMKASDYIKSKALDKLKEINNSKGGETNAKAQQYIDGLLKIPFGIYKQDELTIILKDINTKIKKHIILINSNLKYIEETYSLLDNDLDLITNLKLSIKNVENNKNELKKPLILDIFVEELKLYLENDEKKDLIDLNKIHIMKTYLSNIKNIKLKDICDKLELNKKGTKIELVLKILDCKIDYNLFKIIFPDINKFNSINNLEYLKEFKIIKTNIENILEIWKFYKKEQKQYLENIDMYLDNAVYGLDDAKNQIRRIIGQWINGSNLGYILGFEGPPGTGKTTLAKKGISMCLSDDNSEKRPFVFIALGGSSNGSTLEGHNYTYVGSTWGRIVEALIESKCMNPIIYIDELDKISRTEQGKEIVGILTHLTDPSQNEEFTDKYFSGIKFDISKCLIIFSYNDYSLIDRVLIDRIHRIQINALSKLDKLIVANNHLLPEIYENVGISKNLIEFSDHNIIYVIDIYTYEPGARKLKEKLYEIIREVNLEYLKNNITLPYTITKEFIDKLFINCNKFNIKKINNEPLVGLVNGLYATNSGIGGITIIETFKNYSNNIFDLLLTGQQGDVMKESMQVAKTLSWNLIPKELKEKISDEKSKKFGIHVHCPAGATPKDGPSAGTAITLAILSLLSGFKIKNEYGITGEIDLNGNVTEIGGLEAKVDGAKASGIKTVLCPALNKDDLYKIRNRKLPPEDENFKIIEINNIYDAIEHMMIFPPNLNSNYFTPIHM